MDAYTEVLRGGLGLFYASDKVRREEWRRYIATLSVDEVWPGIQGIGYAEIDRQMVRRLVKASGLRADLEETTSAREGLARCLSKPFDCVILDNRLPDGDGVDLAKQIADAIGPGSPPIVMLTGAGNERLAVKAMRAGIHDYIVKDETTPELIEEAVLGAITAKADARRQFEQSVLLERQAMTDELTELGNRRHFEETMKNALDDAGRKENALALLAIDLNGFKQVNDTFGHGAGDDVLRQVGERLRRSVREGDTAFRLGGDEFTVVMTNDVSPTTAQRLADRLTIVISEPFDLATGSVTVGGSVGVSHVPQDGTDIASLLEAADRRMYVSKARARDLPKPDDEARALKICWATTSSTRHPRKFSIKSRMALRRSSIRPSPWCR